MKTLYGVSGKFVRAGQPHHTNPVPGCAPWGAALCNGEGRLPNLPNSSHCCGCTACASACAVDAIFMRPDAMGFVYPDVDATKCRNCGACERVCAFHDNYDKRLNLPRPIAYGVRHKALEEVRRSRSGAAFVAVSDCILERDGVVYGAGYADHFRVVHKRAITKAERDEFRGSKYVQSDLSGVFKQVRRDLTDGREVLFSGTPCQTAGLNSYVGSSLRRGLLLVDIVCHGVPSPYLWHDYLSHLEEKHHDEIVRVSFRNKAMFGWAAHKETFEFSGGGMCVSDTFYKHVFFRRSCGICPYANTRRPSDITLADFWGWEKTNPEANKDDLGLNLLLVNTAKGKEIFDSIRDRLDYFPASLENVLQPNLMHPTAIDPRRDQFETDYIRRGFGYAYRKYADKRPTLAYRAMRKAHRLVKAIFG